MSKIDQPLYRVTIVVHSLNCGGAQLRLATIANGLAARGAAVRFVAISGVGELGDTLDPRVRLVKLKSHARRRLEMRALFGCAPLRRELAASRPDIVMAGITNVHGVTARAVAGLPPEQRPLLVMRASRHLKRDRSHRSLFSRMVEPLRRAAQRRDYARADHIIAVADEVAAPIRDAVNEPARVSVIDNPVIDEAFDAALGDPIEHRWASDERDAPLLVAVGRLVHQKGFDLLLDAFARLIKRRPARLVILGEGKKRPELEAQRAALGIEEMVELRGHEQQVAPWLARADLILSSSRFEGASAALVEGLAAGCPMVVTDCPGNSRSLVEQSEAGLVVPTDDPDALADAIERALATEWNPAAIRAKADRFRVAPQIDHYHRTLLAVHRARNEPSVSARDREFDRFDHRRLGAAGGE